MVPPDQINISQVKLNQQTSAPSATRSQCRLLPVSFIKGRKLLDKVLLSHLFTNADKLFLY